jgi:hypothetical protein
MTNLPPLSDEERADLVAYLDGELSKSAAQALEARFQTDPRWRAEADTLRRTWEVLDYLPKAEPSVNFTSQTLNRVSVIRPAPSRWKVSSRWQPWMLGGSWAAAVIVAALVGYGGSRLFSYRPPSHSSIDSNEIQPHLVKDFRVIENRHLYQHADDIDFLRALQDPELFGEEN